MQYNEFASVYDALMYDAQYDTWVEFIKRRIPQGKKIVELAAGTGEATVRLCKNYEVIANELSPEMLNIAAQKLRAAGEKIKLICEDMCNLSLHKPVDAAVCVCDGINYLTKEGQLLQAFKAIRSNLVLGGEFIFDISSEHKLKNMHEQVFFDDDDDVTYLWKNTFDQNSKTLTMEITFFMREDEKYRRFDETHIQRAFSLEEIKQALEQSGFILDGIFDNYSLKNANEKSERITFCAIAK